MFIMTVENLYIIVQKITECVESGTLWYKISTEVSRIQLRFNGKVICEHSQPSDPIMAPANSLIMTVRRHPMVKSIIDLCTY